MWLHPGNFPEPSLTLRSRSATPVEPDHILERDRSTAAGAAVECWWLEAVFPGGLREQFWIAQNSRDLIRVLSHLSPDTLEQYAR
jgi:hypothetical protein